MQPRWQFHYAGFLIALWLAQTLARLFLYRAAWGPYHPVTLLAHAATIGALFLLAAMIVGVLAKNWPAARTLPWLGALLFATLHCALTLFDLCQLASHYLTRLPAPISLPFESPRLAASLLRNTGVDPNLLLLAIVLLWLLFVLLYLPARGAIVRLSARLLSVGPRIGRARPLAGAFILFCVAAVVAFHAAAPQWLLRKEPFHFESRMLRLAPVSLVASAADPPPSRPRPAAPPAGSRPLVLIIVDALRSDRMGVYEPAHANTPFLSGLAAAGRLQRLQAYSACTHSYCGIMSVLASRSWNDFGRRPRTLIDALADHGYRPHLFLAGDHHRFGRIVELYGYGVVARHLQQRGDPDDAFVLDRLRRSRFPEPRRTFLYIHLMSAHRGAIMHPPFARPGDHSGLSKTFGLFDRARYPSEYARRIRQTDAVLRHIFAILASKRLLDDALVIITADHGERTGETGPQLHGGEPDAATVRVPLLIYDGTRQRYSSRTPASQIDVAPTMLAAIGLEPPAQWRGIPLQRQTGRRAVPVGTFEATGAIASERGRIWLYFCRRETGEEQVSRLAGPPMRPDRELLARLRRHHLNVGSPIPERACRRGA